MTISTTPEKLQQVGDEIGEQPSVSSIPFIYIEGKKSSTHNAVILETLLDSSNSYIIGHDVNGIMGAGFTGIGGGDLVIESSSDSPTTFELMRRSYSWNSERDFQKGTKSDNVDISQGFIQLGNVTIKDILLEHK